MKKKCRRASVPLCLRLFSDQLRRKAEQCLEAQARAADLQLMRELEAFFGATDESAPAVAKEEEVDAPSEGGVDVVWGQNDHEHKTQQQPGKFDDADNVVCGDNHGRAPSEDNAFRGDVANVGGGGHLDDWGEDDDDDDVNVVWLNHRE